MEIKSIMRDKVWILPVVLLVFGVLTCCEFYFVSQVAQYIYYVVYYCLAVLTIILIRQKFAFQIHPMLLILITVLACFITDLNTYIGLPLFLIFPLFFRKKSNIVWKVLSIILYAFIVIAISALLLFRTGFLSVTLEKSVVSPYTADIPNFQQTIEVYSINQGALGGDTEVKHVKKYFNFIKKNRTIYCGRWGEGQEVKWLDDSHVQIDYKTFELMPYYSNMRMRF